MKIEKEKKKYCFGDIKIGECFTTASGKLFIKTNASSEDKYREVLDGAVNLETGDLEYFGDGTSVFPVSSKIIIEEIEKGDK